MDQVNYMLHRDEYEKDVYERQELYRKLEARWPKWIKISSWIIWGIFLLLGFLFHSSAMGLMLGFVIGGGISLGYEALCRVIYAKKHGITDIRGKKTMRELAQKQTERWRAREEERVAGEIEAKNDGVVIAKAEETPGPEETAQSDDASETAEAPEETTTE